MPASEKHRGLAKKLREARLRKAYKHSNELGAGARAREKHLKTPEENIEATMHEFKEGTLHSGSGQLVTDRKQALAIAMRTAGIKKKRKG